MRIGPLVVTGGGNWALSPRPSSGSLTPSGEVSDHRKLPVLSNRALIAITPARFTGSRDPLARTAAAPATCGDAIDVPQLKCSLSGAWFRGVASSTHDLTPKLFRSTGKPHAERSIYQAYLRTRHATPHNGSSSWLHLIDMQHLGTPTRLLDWTECFGVALYFALLGYDGTTSPCIWVLNPFTLAQRARASTDKSIGDFHIDRDMDCYERFCRADTWPWDHPMPFFAPTPNERIIAQRGFFTVHGRDARPLDRTCQRHVLQVPLHPSAIDEAHRFLDLSGISAETMFPDAQGWLEHVNSTYFY